MPVTVRVGVAGGEMSCRRRWVRQREDTIVVDGVQSAPTMIVFDDGNRILKTLSLRPADRAARDAAPPRFESLESLVGDRPARRRERRTPRRRRHSRDAATSSDYFLTRAQAASALGAMPASVAVPALAQGAARYVEPGAPGRDRSTRARWRRGGAFAFAEPPGSSDAQLCRAGARRSPRSLGSTTANRRALIVEGLRTPSYRDAIQNAALGAAVRSGDTSLVEPVHALIGEQQVFHRSRSGRWPAAEAERALDLLDLRPQRPAPLRAQWTLDGDRSIVRPRAGPAHAQGGAADAHARRHAGGVDRA